MRKITIATCAAFERGEKLTMGNTASLGEMLTLHGHPIAYRDEDGELWINSCGYNTMTTRERLNGLNGVRVSTKQGQMFLNGKAWDGDAVKVSSHHD